jgi:protein-tyrosine-phosphatase
MAHAIFVAEAARRQLAVDVYSAGVFDFRGAPPIRETTATCELNKTPAPEEVATWVSDLPLRSISLFLVMEQFHADVLIDEYGVSRDRVYLLGKFDPHNRGQEIEDPFGQSNAVYQESYDQLRDCIVNYLDNTDLDCDPGNDTNRH